MSGVGGSGAANRARDARPTGGDDVAVRAVGAREAARAEGASAAETPVDAPVVRTRRIGGSTGFRADSLASSLRDRFLEDAPNAAATSPAAATDRAAAAEGVRVQRPTAQLEAEHFDKLIFRLGLTDAVEDGIVTEQEARDVGIAIDGLRAAAAIGGADDAVDTYAELLHLESDRFEIAAIPRDKLLDPASGGRYLVFAPKAFHGALAPLLKHRHVSGQTVALVDPEDVYALYGQTGPEALGRFVKEATERWGSRKPRSVLLVGDSRGQGETVPTFRLDRATEGHPFIETETFASDNPYGDLDGDRVPELAVGRLPVDDESDLQTMVSKIVAYEATRRPGLWSTRATLVDGNPAWGGFVDRAVETITKMELDALPADMDTSRVSFNPASEIGGPNTRLVHERYEEGPLLLSYVGHGQVRSVDGLRVADVVHLRPREGNPIVTLTACLTGSYDESSGDSLAEAALKGGAIAAVGGSQITTPDVNAAWARTLGEEILEGKDATLGGSFVRAKSRLADGDTHGVSGFMDRASNAVLGAADALGLGALGIPGPMRPAHLHLYNLMGDPGTLVRRPKRLAALTAPGDLKPGDAVPISLELPPGMQHDGTAFVTIEAPLGETATPQEDPDEEGISLAERSGRIERNARRYNERVVARMAVPIVGGRIAGDVRLPPGSPPGTYNLRVSVVGAKDVAVGVVEGVRVTARASGDRRVRVSTKAARVRELLGGIVSHADESEIADIIQTSGGDELSRILREIPAQELLSGLSDREGARVLAHVVRHAASGGNAHQAARLFAAADDDIAFGALKTLADRDLTALAAHPRGRAALRSAIEALDAGYTTDAEQTQIDRLRRALG